MQEKEDQGCLLWHWYRTTAQGLKTRIEKHVVLQGVESIRHLSVLRLKIPYGTCKIGHCLFCMSECAIFLAMVKKNNLVLGEKAAAAQVIICGFQRMKGRRKSFFVIFFN